MNTKRFNKSCLIIILILVFIFLLILSACDTSEKQETYVSAKITGPTEIFVGEFDISDYKLILQTAEGETKDVTVTEDILTIDDVSQFEKAGEYALSVEYSGISLTLQITVVKDVYDISGIVFEDETVVYDGKEHNLEIKGELPAGVTVTYEGNGQIDTGVYTVTAKFSGDDEKFEAIEDMTATLTIEKRELELAVTGETALVFNDKEQKTINVVATNVLEGDEVALSVVYSGNMIDVGKYTATIVLEENKNYKLPEDGTVINITISKRMFRVFFKQEGQPDIVCEVPEGTALDINSVREPIQIPGYEVEWEETDLSCVTEDIEVGTVKTPLPFEITYVLNGGENNAANPATYTIESDTINLYAPKKSLSTFEGWYTTEGFSAGTKIAAIESGSIGNITLYAKWIDYRIETAYGFDIDYSGEIPTVKKVVSNSIVNVDLNASFTVSEGCTWKLYADFIGNEEYKLKAMTLGVGENIAYIIVYHPDGEHFTRYALNIYRLDIKEYTFMDGLNQWYSGSVEGTGMIDAPGSNPSKTGYTFVGWSVNGEIVDFPYELKENTLFVSEYEANTYTITYRPNGGDLDVLTQEVTFDSPYTLYEISRTGYTFAGYTYNDQVHESGIWKIAQDIAIEATWIANTYTITYLPNGGTLDKLTQEVTFDEEYTLYEITKTGYSFTGYTYLDESFESGTWSITNNIEVEATWQANNYTITYDPNGGDMAVLTQEVTFDAPFVLSEANRLGFVFKGFTLDGESITSGIWHTAKDVILVAAWKVIDYDITYELNGGQNSGKNPDTYTVNDSISFADPCKTGYAFKGWYLDSEFNEPITGIVKGTIHAITVYAKFEIINYTITYELNGGQNSKENPETYTVKDSITFADPYKTGYAFAGWYRDNEFNEPITDIEKGTIDAIIVYAKFEVINYTITYELNGGQNSEENPKSYTVEEEITFAIPFKNGYEFKGWYLDSEFKESINSIEKGTTNEITIYAKFDIIKYVINYELNGGQNSEENPETYTVEDSFIFASASRKGYEFKGWYLDSEFKEAITNIEKGTTEEITIYAKFDIIKYVINYELNGGQNSEENPETYTVEDSVKFNAPSKNGYTFKGWYLDDKYNILATQIVPGTIGELTLYVAWQANTNILRFDSNGGLGEMPNVYLDTNSGIALPQNAFVKEGYSFVGWATTNDGQVRYSDEAYFVMGTANEYTLFAKWSANSYTVTFEDILIERSFVVSFYSDTSLLYTRTVTAEQGLEYSRPSKTGYVFIDWYTNPECTGEPYNFASSITSDMNLYAKWVAAPSMYKSINYIEGSITASNKGTAIATGDIFLTKKPNCYYFVAGRTENLTLSYKGHSAGTYSQTTIQVYNVTKGKKVLSTSTENSGSDSSQSFNKKSFEVQKGDIYYIACSGRSTELSALYTISLSRYYRKQDGGKVPSSMAVCNLTQDIEYGSSYVFPVAKKEGYTFCGWYNDVNGTGIQFTDETGQCLTVWDKSKDITLYAKWMPNNNILRFEANGGIGDMPDAIVQTGDAQKLPKNTFTREGYAFIGWSTTNNGEVDYVDEELYVMGVLNENILYAKWQEI